MKLKEEVTILKWSESQEAAPGCNRNQRTERPIRIQGAPRATPAISAAELNQHNGGKGLGAEAGSRRVESSSLDLLCDQIKKWQIRL